VRVNLRDPRTRNLIFTLFVAGAGVYLFFGADTLPFGFRRTAAQIKSLRGDYERKSSDLARARQAVADLPRFEAEFNALHERYEMAAELLPADRELPGLLRKITLAGQQAGIVFQSVRPEPPITREHYTELPIHVTVRGGYHQVGQFLAQLANLERIVNVGTISVTSFSAPDEDATCEASFTASAYMMNPADAAAQSAGGGKKS